MSCHDTPAVASSPPGNRLARLVAHPAFEAAIIATIVLNAAVIGLETSSRLQSRYGTLLGGLNLLFQVVFVTEITLRLQPAGRARGGSFATAGTCSTLPLWRRR